MPGTAGAAEQARRGRELRTLAQDETPGGSEVLVVATDDVGGEILRRVADCDLVVMGLQRKGRSRKVLGAIPLDIARRAAATLIMISQRGRPGTVPENPPAKRSVAPRTGIDSGCFAGKAAGRRSRDFQPLTMLSLHRKWPRLNALCVNWNSPSSATPWSAKSSNAPIAERSSN